MTQSKAEVLQEYMAIGVAQILLDSRRPGVVVPECHLGNPALCLSLAWRFLNFTCEWDAVEIRTMMTFNQVPFHCVIPWDAVYAMRTLGDGAFVQWGLSTPEDVMLLSTQEEKQKPRGHLRLVKPGDNE